MLSQVATHSSSINRIGFIANHNRTEDVAGFPVVSMISLEVAQRLSESSPDEISLPEGEDTSLENAAQTEQEYLRRRLREELKREPTQEELDEWLRQHTEGY